MSQSRADIIDRARRYLATMDPSISGQGGHDRAFAAASRLVEGFGLTIDEATPLMHEFSSRCSPPWTAKEIAHKLADALRLSNPSKVGEMAVRGWEGHSCANLRTPVAVPDTPVARSASLDGIAAVLKRRGKVVKAWKYTNPTGEVLEVVVRYQVAGAKRYSPWIPDPDCGGWIEKHPEAPRPLYNLPRIASANRVLVVEGEQCAADADALFADHAPEWAATTSSGGKDSAHLADWSPLKGKRVTIWPDHDAPDKQGRVAGQKYAAAVREALDGIAASVDVIDPSLLELAQDGSDISDWLAQWTDAPPSKCRLLLEALDAASILDSPADELAAHYADIIAGRIKCVAWPHRELTELTRALTPGSVTLLCGSAGATKSFFLLECMAYWHNAGERVAVYELEDSRTIHLKRAHAQRAGLSGITDMAWVARHGETVTRAAERDRDWLSAFGNCITATVDGVADNISFDAVTEWVDKQAKKGCRIIGVDPITILDPGPKPWLTDLRFINSMKRVAAKHGCSIILVSHPKKGALGTNLDDLAGGSAYVRLSHCVLWLQHLDGDEQAQVKGTISGMSSVETINRILINRKARGGIGVGRGIGFYFDPATLRFTERGVLIPQAKKKTPSRG